jgi:hypothetical protein
VAFSQLLRLVSGGVTVMWELKDYTKGKNTGYLQLERNGVRVCDAFPFAAKADPEFVRSQMIKITECMNNFEHSTKEPAS